MLVVDDERDTRETVCFLLGAWGHDAHAAGDGAAAVRAAEVIRPDVVLLDLELGGPPNGYEAARQIRGLAGKQPFIVCVSGHGKEEDRRRGREADFDHHLLKPADPEDLRRLLGSVGTGRRGRLA